MKYPNAARRPTWRVVQKASVTEGLKWDPGGCLEKSNEGSESQSDDQGMGKKLDRPIATQRLGGDPTPHDDIEK